MHIVPPDAPKMAYEKAEISGADIIHFKNLSDEPNGIQSKMEDLQKYLE